MIKVEINSIFGSILFSHECENNTIKKTVIEAVKTGANLNYADLSYADLSGANLRGAGTDKRYISISCIGSAKRMTTYCFEDDIIWCGCFTGTLEQFENKVIETHKNNEQYLKEYTGFINYLKSLK